jgi:hypothetical protein
MANLTKNNEIEINGVILSEMCLDELKNFQENENGYLKDQLILLSDCIDFISKRLFGRSPRNEEEDLQKASLLVSDLAFLKDNLKNLQRVVEK